MFPPDPTAVTRSPQHQLPSTGPGRLPGYRAPRRVSKQPGHRRCRREEGHSSRPACRTVQREGGPNPWSPTSPPTESAHHQPPAEAVNNLCVIQTDVPEASGAWEDLTPGPRAGARIPVSGVPGAFPRAHRNTEAGSVLGDQSMAPLNLSGPQGGLGWDRPLPSVPFFPGVRGLPQEPPPLLVTFM